MKNIHSAKSYFTFLAVATFIFINWQPVNAESVVSSEKSMSADQIANLDYTIAATPSRDLPGYRKIKRALLTMAATPGLLERLQQVAPGVEFVPVNGPRAKQLPNGSFDAIFLFCSVAENLDAAGSAIWVHTYSSGVDKCLAHPEMQEGRIIFSSSRGANAIAVAEHAIALMIAHAKELHNYRDYQNRSLWNRDSFDEGSVWELGGKTMLVLGLGAVGKQVAKRANALGMRVIATRNSSREGPDYVDYVGLPDETLKLATEADVVVNALPLTNDTRGLINTNFFRAMNSHAIIVSVGRGQTMVTDDLIAALRAGDIAGAALDVMDPEPIPPNNPLWQMPNVTITPHVAGGGRESQRRIFQLLVENVRRYQSGEPLLNPVNY